MKQAPLDDDAPTRMHGWLIRHKIIFDTVVGGVLVVASLFVAYLQWRTAVAQTAVARRQSEPTFVISTRLKKPAGEDNYSEDELVVENFGGAAREVQVRYSTWLFVSVTKMADKHELLLPLDGYYTATISNSGAATGILSQTIGNHNNQIFSDLERSVREMAKSKEYYSEMDIRRYVSVSYRDILGTIHNEYYYVQPISGAAPITNTEGTKFVDDWMKSGDVLEFDKLTPAEVIERSEGLFEKE